MSKLVKWSFPAMTFAVAVALLGVRADAQEGSGKAAAKVKVSGVVLMDDGSPAAAARVRLMPPSTKKADKAEGTAEKPAPQQATDGKDGAKKPGEGADGEKPGEKKPARPEPIAETTTDAEGKFELEAPPGKYRLVASMKGAANATKTITLEDGKNQDKVELKLKPMPKKAPAAPAQ